MCYNTVGRHQHIGEINSLILILLGTVQIYSCALLLQTVLYVTSFTDRTISLTSQTAVS